MSCPTILQSHTLSVSRQSSTGHYCCKCGISILYNHSFLTALRTLWAHPSSTNPTRLRCPNPSCQHLFFDILSTCSSCQHRVFHQRPVWECWVCERLNPMRVGRVPSVAAPQRCYHCGFTMNEACRTLWDRHGLAMPTVIVEAVDEHGVMDPRVRNPIMRKRGHKVGTRKEEKGRKSWWSGLGMYVAFVVGSWVVWWMFG
ncbi:hypothetical protein EX30DRAFT_340767 [Ascodesmis nigricans]|uniref:Uncharacterized protein n=1 Tax=Ascodesmis nigricans TaxID=341454 RepID=A0A4S2MXR2_9PEZI|nr:hypothetical protein EX30DRAFT_340767 [Ascodesmis nigricans]